MWNQSNYQLKTSYYPYSARRKEQLAKFAKYKLIIMLLSKGTSNLMRQTFHQIKQKAGIKAHKLKRLDHLIEVHFNISLKLAFEKIKQNVNSSRIKQKSLKSFLILVNRIEKNRLKQHFSNIFLHIQRKTQNIVINMEHQRKLIFWRKVQNIFVGKKKKIFNGLLKYSQLKRSQLKKLKVVQIISRQYIKHVKQLYFNRLSKNYYSSRSSGPSQHHRPIKNISLQKQIEQKKNLQMQLQDMTVKLQNKNQSIGRLQQQIQQLKTQSVNNHSFSQYTLNLNNLNKSRTNSIKRISQNEFSDSGMDFSLGSILGTSFTSMKSKRNRSKHANDSMASIDCTCGYKQKYLKYKNSHQSLKNQLQIVKEQLQVAKDLNDHFTNQIKQYFNGDKHEFQLDRLKKQTVDLQRQRDDLRMKVAKYQHHVSNMKAEFKTKIEELYRRVKKER